MGEWERARVGGADIWKLWRTDTGACRRPDQRAQGGLVLATCVVAAAGLGLVALRRDDGARTRWRIVAFAGGALAAWYACYALIQGTDLTFSCL